MNKVLAEHTPLTTNFHKKTKPAISWLGGKRKLDGQWLLTHQDSPIVREAFSGYDIVSLERPNGIGNRGKVRSGRRYREVIITKCHLAKEKSE